VPEQPTGGATGQILPNWGGWLTNKPGRRALASAPPRSLSNIDTCVWIYLAGIGDVCVARVVVSGRAIVSRAGVDGGGAGDSVAVGSVVGAPATAADRVGDDRKGPAVEDGQETGSDNGAPAGGCDAAQCGADSGDAGDDSAVDRVVGETAPEVASCRVVVAVATENGEASVPAVAVAGDDARGDDTSEEEYQRAGAEQTATSSTLDSPAQTKDDGGGEDGAAEEETPEREVETRGNHDRPFKHALVSKPHLTVCPGTVLLCLKGGSAPGWGDLRKNCRICGKEMDPGYRPRGG